MIVFIIPFPSGGVRPERAARGGEQRQAGGRGVCGDGEGRQRQARHVRFFVYSGKGCTLDAPE